MNDAFMRDASQKEVEMVEHLMRPKGIEGFWTDVDLFMKYLYEKFPGDMAALELQAQAQRETAFNKYSASKNLSLRNLGIMPDMLLKMLDRIYGTQYPVDIEKFKRLFFKRYPKLRIAEYI